MLSADDVSGLNGNDWVHKIVTHLILRKKFNARSTIILTICMQKQSHRKVKQTAGVFIINK